MSLRKPQVYNGKYVGSVPLKYMDYILALRNTERIDAFKNMIFDFPPDLVLRSIEENKSIRNIIREENIDWKPYIGELRDYQTLMAAFMYMSPRSLNGDYVGLGKTAEVAALINYLRQRNELTRFCMAVEGSALGQTACEMRRFTGLNVISLPGDTAKIRRLLAKADFTNIDGIVCKHTTLKNDYFLNFISQNIGSDHVNTVFNTLFIDESSVIKNSATKLCDYIHQILNVTPRCHLMNATPFSTSIMDIYVQLDVLDEYLLPSKSRIESTYCEWGNGCYWKTVNGRAERFNKRERKGYKNQEQFKQSLELVYWGRGKKEVGKELPHVYRVLEVEPTKEQKVAIANGHRYQEVLNCPSLIPEIEIKTDRKSVPKIDRICDLMEQEFAEVKVMIYVWNPEAQEAIANELKKLGRKPAIIRGGMKDVDKWTIQTEFNREDGNYDVIITNTKRSLNLMAADACILYSAESSSGNYIQICGRIDRSVDDKIKTYIMLLYKDTDEFAYINNTVSQRAKDSRDLTIDTKSAIDYFIDSMREE